MTSADFSSFVVTTDFLCICWCNSIRWRDLPWYHTFLSLHMSATFTILNSE